MMELFEMMLTTGLWASVIRIATPLIFATLGELICERAGVLTLGYGFIKVETFGVELYLLQLLE